MPSLTQLVHRSNQLASGFNPIELGSSKSIDSNPFCWIRSDCEQLELSSTLKRECWLAQPHSGKCYSIQQSWHYHFSQLPLLNKRYFSPNLFFIIYCQWAGLIYQESWELYGLWVLVKSALSQIPYLPYSQSITSKRVWPLLHRPRLSFEPTVSSLHRWP